MAIRVHAAHDLVQLEPPSEDYQPGPLSRIALEFCQSSFSPTATGDVYLKSTVEKRDDMFG